MDRDTFVALLEEGWTPPGQIPELLTISRVAEALRTRSTTEDRATELPEPDTHVAGVPLWLRPTVERSIAEREALIERVNAGRPRRGPKGYDTEPPAPPSLAPMRGR